MSVAYDIPAVLELIGSQPMVAAARPLVADSDDAVYLVGGSVRDLLLGRSPLEVDLAVEGDALALAREVANACGGELIEHERFGTAIVRTEELQLDFASTRSETYPTPGALPVVAAASMDDDLERRDFSINAIAISLTGGTFGQIKALPGSLADLESGTIRVLHKLSFVDDPTRLMRMCRYAARLGFGISDSTRKLATSAIANGALETISPARVGAELSRCLNSSEPDAGLDLLSDFGIFEWIGADFDPNRISKAKLVAGTLADTDEVRIASLFLGAHRSARLESLDLPPRLAKVAAEASRSGELADRLSSALTRSALAELLRGRSIAVIAAAAGVSDAGQINSRLWFNEVSLVGSPLSAADLFDAGVPEGPGIGIGLRAGWNWYLDAEEPSSTEALRVAVDAARAASEGP